MMQNLYTLSTKTESQGQSLTEVERFSVLYHDLFDFPLDFSEMIRWSAGKKCPAPNDKCQIFNKNGFLFVEGKEGIIYKRVLRRRISAKKLEIAKRAAGVLSIVPGIKMVAVTGSLAMGNSTDDSDIDFMIITKKGRLWTTRFFTYLLVGLFGIQKRRPMDKIQKDKLCMNVWLDESDMVWRERNVYSAHEIGQILPLVNKNSTYEKLLYKNRWILDFWPNSVKIRNQKMENEKSTPGLLEKVCFWIQYQHMKPKITREVVTPTRALFHPQDWGKVVLDRIKSFS